MAFAIRRLAVSPIPIGLTPGHLSKAISLYARKDAIPRGSRSVVHRRLAHPAKAWHRSFNALNEMLNRHKA